MPLSERGRWCEGDAPGVTAGVRHHEQLRVERMRSKRQRAGPCRRQQGSCVQEAAAAEQPDACGAQAPVRACMPCPSQGSLKWGMATLGGADPHLQQACG